MKRWVVLLKVLISAALLYWIITKNNILHSILLFSSTRISLLLLSFALAYIAWVIAAMKWRLLLAEQNIISMKQAFKYTLVSLAYATVLPGGQLIGEAGKYFHLRERTTIRNNDIVQSIIVDKMLGLCSLVVVGFIGATADTQTPQFVITAHWLLLLCAAVYLMLVAGSVAVMKSKTTVILTKASRLLQLKSLLSMMLPRTLKRGNIYASFIYSIMFQLIIVSILQLLALSLDMPIRFTALMWIYSATSLLIALPISYAGFGVREISFSFFFSLFGVPTATSITFSLLVYGLMLSGALPGILLIYTDMWLRRGVNLNKIAKHGTYR